MEMHRMEEEKWTRARKLAAAIVAVVLVVAVVGVSHMRHNGAQLHMNVENSKGAAMVVEKEALPKTVDGKTVWMVPLISASSNLPKVAADTTYCPNIGGALSDGCASGTTQQITQAPGQCQVGGCGYQGAVGETPSDCSFYFDNIPGSLSCVVTPTEIKFSNGCTWGRSGCMDVHGVWEDINCGAGTQHVITQSSCSVTSASFMSGTVSNSVGSFCFSNIGWKCLSANVAVDGSEVQLRFSNGCNWKLVKYIQ